MNRFKKYLSCLMLIALSFSCAAHKQIDHAQQVPPPQPESSLQDTDRHLPPVQLSQQREIIAHYAIQSIGIPYKWGGQSPKTGFDCSGLASYTYKKAGIVIPRTSKAQLASGQFIEKNKLQVGDLVFFKGTQKKGGLHVGIYLGDGVLIHAPGKGRHVSFEKLDHPYFKKYYIGSRQYL